MWRFSVTRGVVFAACAGIVAIAILENHVILAVGLALFFGLIASVAVQEGIADHSERMSTLYRALGRVHAKTSRQRFGSGPVGRWAGTLREADYCSLAGSNAHRRKARGAAVNARSNA